MLTLEIELALQAFAGSYTKKIDLIFTWGTFGHDCKEQPRSSFICIVRTGHKVKEKRKWISIWFRNTSDFGAWWPKVFEQNMDA